MRFKLLTVGGCVAMGLVALSAEIGRAQTGSAGGKIQFSAPSNPTVASNLNQLNPHQSTFKQVEDDLFKPFRMHESFHAEPFPVSPPQQVMPQVQDKRAQEMLDRQRNWAFTDINDLYPDFSLSRQEEDAMNGKDQKPVSVIQRYLENMDKKQLSATNKVNATAWFMESLSGTNSVKALESMTVEGQMMKMMKEAIIPHNAGEMDTDVIDFKRANLKPFTSAQIEEQKRRSEAFQQLLNPHAATPAVTPMNVNLPAGATMQGLLGQTATPDTAPLHRSLTGPVDRASRAFYSHVYDDPTALALGQTNNLLTPKPQAAPLTAPLIEPFDPFPKRKF